MTEETPDVMPTPEDEGQHYLQLLAEWQDTESELKKIKARELDLRNRLFAGAFPKPTEGANTHELPDGRKLKGQYKINRRVDEAALPAVLDELREHGVANADVLVKYKPELAKREWNSLSDEAKVIFSKAIISNPGTPGFAVTGNAS